MPEPLRNKFTLTHLRQARTSGQKVAMLTCYDYTTARLMQEAGVPALLVGDSAASVILGYETTLPVSLEFMIEITRAVRRGAPLAFLVADMPFGSYHASREQAIENVCRMVKETGCDAVKIEAGPSHVKLVRTLAEGGVAVIPHLGLRPQAVGVIGGYKFQGRTAEEAQEIVALSLHMEEAGAVAILLEAVPPDVANAVVERTTVPVVGCGAGPACHASVIVTHDGLGMTSARPKFVPDLADIASPLRDAFASYVRDVASGAYPAAQHNYPMSPEEQAKLKTCLKDAR